MKKNLELIKLAVILDKIIYNIRNNKRGLSLKILESPQSPKLI